MFIYTVTYSGGTISGAGEEWSNSSNIWDGNDTTCAGSSIQTTFNAVIPYSWTYGYTDIIQSTEHDNTNSSGTILGVFVYIYGYSAATASGTIPNHYTGYLTTTVSGVEVDKTFMLPTSSGEYSSLNITYNYPSWSWSDIDDLYLDIYFQSGNYTKTTELEINSIKLQVVIND